MLREERYSDNEESLRMSFEGLRSKIWTALPGIVQSFDAVAQTAVVQPTIRAVVRNPDGSTQSVALPLLLDCPVFFPAGGGCTLTFPVKEGDECLMVFASRCIDAWWQSGGVQEQAEFRMHDLSDGFCYVGFSSKPAVISNISTTAAQLRSDNGAGYVEVDPDGKIRVQGTDIVLHASHSYSWDVGGFGERWTALGDNKWEHRTWQTGAIITGVSLPINPPEGP